MNNGLIGTNRYILIKPIKQNYLYALFGFFIILTFSLININDAQASDWRYEGIAFYAYETEEVNAKPVFRFYNSSGTDHFYTTSEREKEKLIQIYNQDKNSWRYEGIAFYAYETEEVNAKPVFRFYNSSGTDHFYTTSEREKEKLIQIYNQDKNSWRYEGIAFYAYETEEVNAKPVFRFYNSSGTDHFYTTSEREKEKLEQDLLGPVIKVGIQSYTRNSLENDPFRIEANKSYFIKDRNDNRVAQISGNEITYVKYNGDSHLRVYGSIADKLFDHEVRFEAADGKNSDIIFNIHKPNSTYDKYRGKISLRHSDATRLTWVIDELPLEQYIWGIGEITGTGDDDYDRVMTTAFRTYAYWKILYSTKYATEGFKVDATPGNQIYNGYEWETAYPDIRKAAEITRGKIAKHGSDIALSPYSSWTDGRTRSFEERWGSELYPWCQSVNDPYGKHPTLNTVELEAAGNHMVGISAHGALSLAGDHNWDWQDIIKYYLTGIVIVPVY